MNKIFKVGILVVGIVAIIAGILVYNSKKDGVMQPEKMLNNEAAMEGKTDQAGTMVQGDGMYAGKQLAGKSAPFLEFTKADYEKALQSDKLIVLDFYANWCPICRVEEPELFKGFDSLTTDNVVGFRVNFNDDQTDSDEKALATQLKVPYQHTKVLLKNGSEVSRSSDSWDAAMLKTQVEAAL